MRQATRVLVVEDDSALRQLMLLALSEEGYDTEEAEDGGTALVLAARRQFDVILLDIMMPKMDGWAFLDAYSRRDGQPARVIICSALVEAEPRVADLPAVAFLQKPFTLHDLCASVEHCVKDPR